MKIDFDEYLNLLSEELNIEPDELLEKETFGSLGVDSLSLFSMMEDVEERFGIDIDVEDLTEISGVKKMYDFIVEHSTEASPEENSEE